MIKKRTILYRILLRQIELQCKLFESKSINIYKKGLDCMSDLISLHASIWIDNIQDMIKKIFLIVCRNLKAKCNFSRR